MIIMKKMLSRFKGTCAGCGGAIGRGVAIQYDMSTRRAYHDLPDCVPVSGSGSEWEPDRFDMDYEDRCADACGLR